LNAVAQETNRDTIPVKSDTLPAPVVNLDSNLRIINLNPYFTLHVDSVLQYDLKINRPAESYYWFIKNGPVGVKIDRNTGLLFQGR
jgi:hypothetical protein